MGDELGLGHAQQPLLDASMGARLTDQTLREQQRMHGNLGQSTEESNAITRAQLSRPAGDDFPSKLYYTHASNELSMPCSQIHPAKDKVASL